MRFQKTELSNGIRVLTENHPESRSAVAGFWIHTGTRFEKFEQMGISHLLEHMVFKGTEKYNTLDIARSLEVRGGEINAFTGREHTCFHTLSLNEDLPLSIDVLSQLFAFAKFEQSEFEKEKRVIQQEILMASDDLEEYVFDMLFEKLFPDHPMGYQILGSTQTVQGLTLDDVESYYRSHFVPKNLIVSVTGALEHSEVVKWVEESLAKAKWTSAALPQALPAPKMTTINTFLEKDCEQYHVVVGFPGCKYKDADRLNGYVLNTALGGGMTSRLFQKIREDKGLAYSVFSSLNSFVDSGVHTIYAGTEGQHVEEVVELIQDELSQVIRHGLTDEEVDQFKTQAKGQILIASDDIDSRMNSLAVNEMVLGEYRAVADVIADIDKINQDSLREYIADKLSPKEVSLFVMGEKEIKTQISI